MDAINHQQYNTETKHVAERKAMRNTLKSYLEEDLTLCCAQYPFMPLAPYKTIEQRAKDITDLLYSADEDGQLLQWVLDTSDHNIDFYMHCLHVCFLSIYMMEQYYDISHATPAQRTLYSTELRYIAVAGLLHDIGKRPEDLDVHASYIDKATRSEYKKYRDHVVNGNARLKSTLLPSVIAQAVLQHHESCDGNGFPLRLNEASISLMGKIMAVADFYSHFIGSGNASDPFYCIKQLQLNAVCFDSVVLTRFWTNTLHNVIGQKVRLSDGQKAILVQVNERYPNKSKIKINERPIALSEDTPLEIVGILRKKKKASAS